MSCPPLVSRGVPRNKVGGRGESLHVTSAAGAAGVNGMTIGREAYMWCIRIERVTVPWGLHGISCCSVMRLGLVSDIVFELLIIMCPHSLN